MGGMDLSLFANNVTDAHPLLNLTRSLFYTPYLWTASAFRQRTYGVTFVYHL